MLRLPRVVFALTVGLLAAISCRSIPDAASVTATGASPHLDPAFYDTFTDTYNVLELVKSRVEVSPYELARAIEQPAQEARFPNPPEVNAYTGATWKGIENPAEGG